MSSRLNHFCHKENSTIFIGTIKPYHSISKIVYRQKKLGSYKITSQANQFRLLICAYTICPEKIALNKISRVESQGEDMSSGLKLKLTVCVWPDDALTKKGGA